MLECAKKFEKQNRGKGEVLKVTPYSFVWGEYSPEGLKELYRSHGLTKPLFKRTVIYYKSYFLFDFY